MCGAPSPSTVWEAGFGAGRMQAERVGDGETERERQHHVGHYRLGEESAFHPQKLVEDFKQRSAVI